MDEFVCPECSLHIRPALFYVSHGKTWWSASPTEARQYAKLCRHRDSLQNGTLLGCDSMRVCMDPSLRSIPHDGRFSTPPPSAGKGDISIADVAVGRYAIETCADIPVAFSATVGESFRDPKTRADFQRNPGSTDVTVFELRDVLLVPERLIMFKDAKRITETRYLVDDHDYWKEPSAPRAVHEIGSDKTVVMGINLAFRNYYHWMMQSLPAIDASVRMTGAQNTVLALPPLAPWQDETLAILGLGDVPRVEIEFDCHYRFQRVHWCTYLNGCADNFLSPRRQLIIDRLAAQAEPISETYERLYVSRFDTRNRVIRNEDEVRSLLERLGFVTLVPGLLPLKTQIGLFRGAKFVIGAHGAGLTSLAFCKPGTTVLELVQSTYPELCMNRIAQERGLRYHGECFECEFNDYVHQQDWLVDIKQLETKLLSLL